MPHSAAELLIRLREVTAEQERRARLDAPAARQPSSAAGRRACRDRRAAPRVALPPAGPPPVPRAPRSACPPVRSPPPRPCAPSNARSRPCPGARGRAARASRVGTGRSSTCTCEALRGRRRRSLRCVAGTISFARGAPSLDIVDVEGLRAAADQAFKADPAGLTGLRDLGRLRAAARVDRRAPRRRARARCWSPTARCRPTRSCSTRSSAPGTRSSSSGPPTTARCSRCATAAPTCGWSSSSPTGSTPPPSSACSPPAPQPKLAHIIPNFQNPAGYTLSAAKRERAARAGPRARLHDLRGRPVRGAALRG